MKTTYRIGFFLGIFFLLFLLGIGFQWSYQYAREKSTPIPSVQAEGAAQKNEGYYLMELNGYVTVYFSDKTTIFEYTNIPVDKLSDDLKSEIRTGKYLESQTEVYGFLENYSS